jgi:long-chain fatty acid transport protein
MGPRRSFPAFLPALCLAAALAAAPAAQAQQGISIAGSGPVNLSFGGATTAAPLDSIGAIYWNPATMMGLERPDLSAGASLIIPQTRISSGVQAGAILGLPPQSFSASDRGDNGVFPLPSVGFTYFQEGQPWALGLGLLPVGGFGSNYPADPNNLVFSPKLPHGIAQGSAYSQFQVVDLVAAGAYRLTDRLSVGFAPLVTLALLQEDPGLAAPPDDSNHDLSPTYPALTHTHLTWGAGFHVGLYYELDGGWRLGASYKSPRWLETFDYKSVNELGLPRNDRVRADFPAIYSAGVSYAGLPRWLLAADFRWVDYKNTKGFGETGYDVGGQLRGLGWRSIFALALGAQFCATDTISVRAGYTFNQNPIPDAVASENVGSATVEEHTLFAGASYKLNDAVTLAVAYVHVFGNSITGPLVLPGVGPVNGTFVKDEILDVDSFVAGITVRY